MKRIHRKSIKNPFQKSAFHRNCLDDILGLRNVLLPLQLGDVDGEGVAAAGGVVEEQPDDGGGIAGGVVVGGDGVAAVGLD